LTALISNIDANIGKLFDRLQTLKKDDNTIVVFLTDNGTAAGWPAGMRSEGIRPTKADIAYRVSGVGRESSSRVTCLG
jgi:arylsulfatase A-like enzyme